MKNNPEMLPTEAIKHLRDENVEQLDHDGVMVGVSRQALHEVLAYLDAQPSVQDVAALNSRVEVEAELTRERNQRKVAEAMLASKGGTIARLEIEGMEMAEGLHKLREANRVLIGSLEAIRSECSDWKKFTKPAPHWICEAPETVKAIDAIADKALALASGEV